MAGLPRRAQRSRSAVALPENAGESMMLTRMTGAPPTGSSFFEAASE
jgi:hypothetical protein